MVVPEGTLRGFSLGLCVESAGSGSLFCGVCLLCTPGHERSVGVRASNRAVRLLFFTVGGGEVRTEHLCEERRHWLLLAGCTGACAVCPITHVLADREEDVWAWCLCESGVAGGSWLVAQGSTYSLQSLIWGFRVRNSRFCTFQESNDTPVKFGCNPSAASTICGASTA